VANGNEGVLKGNKCSLLWPISAHLGVSFDEAKLVILRLRRPVNPLKGGHSNLVLNFKLVKLNPIHPTPRVREYVTL